ncbi:unnamed protein product [Parajaminaea phylloscopi]
MRFVLLLMILALVTTTSGMLAERESSVDGVAVQPQAAPPPPPVPKTVRDCNASTYKCLVVTADVDTARSGLPSRPTFTDAGAKVWLINGTPDISVRGTCKGQGYIVEFDFGDVVAKFWQGPVSHEIHRTSSTGVVAIIAC